MAAACAILWSLLAAANVAALFMVRHDKRVSQLRRRARARRRVPERSFLLAAAVGGGPGVLAGFVLLRHKVRKPGLLALTVLVGGVGLLVWWGWLSAFGCA